MTPRYYAPGTVPALSLWQPWASLIAIGAKRIETRAWVALLEAMEVPHAP